MFFGSLVVVKNYLSGQTDDDYSIALTPVL